VRVVVVGASGNVGTSILRALAREPAVTSIVGVARRVPRPDGSSTVTFPHDIAEWVRVDLTDTADAVVRGLDQAFAGADAVVNLAWAVQPSHDQRYLRRVNVLGARAVHDAVVRTGVGHLLEASSVGTYSRGPVDGHRVDETWPADGVPTSLYSVHKAEVERMLDELEAAHPRLVVTRIRPALMFQRGAGSEIAGLFLGGPATMALRAAARTPGKVLGGLMRGWESVGGPPPAPDDGARFPLLPFPAGVRVQALHTDDAGEAFRAAIVGRHPGAFNIAPDDVLTPQDMADLLAGGRLVELPHRVVRTALAGAWRARLAAIDEGWFDLGTSIPMLDASRARSVLRWAPTHTTREAVLEVVDAIIDRARSSTPPLNPSAKRK
jgi:nucleoside-diphosphate-sugar epimerase